MGEGQWRVDDSLSARLNELDDEVAKAVEDGDEAALWRGLQALADTVRSSGQKLDDADLTPSDAVIQTRLKGSHPESGPSRPRLRTGSKNHVRDFSSA